MNEIEEMSYFNRGYREGYEDGSEWGRKEGWEDAIYGVVKLLDSLGEDGLAGVVEKIMKFEEE